MPLVEIDLYPARHSASQKHEVAEAVAHSEIMEREATHRALAVPRTSTGPYEGKNVTGKPITVLLRGVCLIAGEKLQAPSGFGRFIARRPSDPANARSAVEDTTPWLDG